MQTFSSKLIYHNLFELFLPPIGCETSYLSTLRPVVGFWRLVQLRSYFRLKVCECKFILASFCTRKAYTTHVYNIENIKHPPRVLKVVYVHIFEYNVVCKIFTILPLLHITRRDFQIEHIFHCMNGNIARVIYIIIHLLWSVYCVW